MDRLSRRFFSRDAVTVAQALIGRTLYRDSTDGLVAGRIVEVEAYKGSVDPGSHAFKGETNRNEVMFGQAGHLYVYFTYGMHYCSNIVADKPGVAAAVLLRAVEPLVGLDLMADRRGIDEPRLLARGPARLCEAFAIGKEENGSDLAEGAIWVTSKRKIEGTINSSPRIGLREGLEQPWRFYEEGPWVSGPKRLFTEV